MRVTHVSLARPRRRKSAAALLDAWPTLSAVASAVAEAGAEVRVVQSFHRSAELKRDGVEYRFVSEPAWPGRTAGLFPGLVARAVAATRPDVIHVNGLDFPFHTEALTRLGLPVVVQDHASDPATGWRWRRWGLRRIAGVLFTSAGQAEPFIRSGALRPYTPVFAVLEGSTHFTPGNRETSRARAGREGDPAILWVGRLDDNKDPLTILDAIDRAALHLPRLQLRCAFHEAPLLGQVQQRIAASERLRERVTLIGRVPHLEVEKLCRAADLFVLGSHHEGSGYALVEAIACGATPVVSDIPSFRAITGDGGIGALVPVGNADAFAAALIRLARKPRAALRAEAATHFATHLSFPAIGRRLLEIYARVLERRP